MVLFEISRDSTTNQCSYKPLSAKYKQGYCDESATYCTNYVYGTGWPLTGSDGFGYGIEAVEFSYKTGSIVDSDACPSSKYLSF